MMKTTILTTNDGDGILSPPFGPMILRSILLCVGSGATTAARNVD